MAQAVAVFTPISAKVRRAELDVPWTWRAGGQRGRRAPQLGLPCGLSRPAAAPMRLARSRAATGLILGTER
jgi:hypothetical protein